MAKELTDKERAALTDTQASLIRLVTECRGLHSAFPMLMTELVEAVLGIDFILPNTEGLPKEEVAQLRSLRGYIYDFEKYAA